MLWVPGSVTHFTQNDFFYDQPARAETICSYGTYLDPFSQPLCLNLITLHLAECHYKLRRYNSVVSNECSIKQRAPPRQTRPNEANWMLPNWHSLIFKSHWSLESTSHLRNTDFYINFGIKEKHFHPVYTSNCGYENSWDPPNRKNIALVLADEMIDTLLSL